MRVVVGGFGDGIRGDVQIRIEPGLSLTTQLRSSVKAMYGRAIESQVEKVLLSYGSPNITLELQDSGALPFVIEARLEAALCSFLGRDLPPLSRRDESVEGHQMLRTRMYVPGNVPKLLPNIDLYQADAVILDLEDSVAPTAKSEARSLVRHALHQLDFGRSRRFVRINFGEEGLEDAKAVCPQGVDALVVPKVEEPQDLANLAQLLDDLGVATKLVPLLESAKGITNAYRIASSTTRNIALAIGLEDYLTDIRAIRTPEGLESQWAHGEVVNAARAAGTSPLASVYSAIDDEEGLTAYASKMMGMGFDGVGCIHPSQVRTVHQAFAPSEDELAGAIRIVDAYEEALNAGIGAIAVDGGMVDQPVYARAKRIVERATAGGS